MAEEEQNELPPGSSYLFNADAQAVLEASPDLDTGLTLLKEAYTANDWDKPEEAAKTASNYAQQLRYRFKDTMPMSKGEVISGTPIPISSVDYSPEAETPEEKNVSQINNWEKDNLDILETTTDPDYVIHKTKIIEGIKSQASLMRQENIGKKEGFWTDSYYRAKEGLTGGIARLVGAESYLNNLREHENPVYDEYLPSQIAGGVGFVGGLAAAGAAAAVTAPVALAAGASAATAATASWVVGGIASGGYLFGNSAGIVKSTYENSLKTTGDSGRATIAASIETGSQVLQTALGVKVLGGAAKSIGKAVFGGAVTGAEKVASNTLSNIAVKGAETGAIFAAGGEASQVAQNVGQNVPIETDIGRRTLNNAALGTIFGSGTAGLAALAGRGRAAPDPNIDPPDLGVTPPIEKVQIGGPESEVTLPSDAPVFKTKAGSTYTVTPEGATQRTMADGRTSLPLDITRQVTPEIAEKLSGLQRASRIDGLKAVLTTDGENLYIKSNHVKNDLTISNTPTESVLVPVPTTDVPTSGTFPVEAAGPRNTNGNEIIHQSHIGQEVVPEAEGGSAGAMLTKESALGRRVRTSPALDPELKAVAGNEQEGSGLFQYIVLPNKETTDKAQRFVVDNGVERATAEMLAIPYGEGTIQDSGNMLELVKIYREAHGRAKEVGDTARAEQAAQLYDQLLDRGRALATGGAQMTQFQSKWAQAFDPEMKTMALRTNIVSGILKEVAAEQGVEGHQLRSLPQDLEAIDTQLKVFTKEGFEPTPGQRAEISELKARKTKLENLQQKIEDKKTEKLKSFKENETQFTKLLKIGQKTTGDIQEQAFREAYRLQEKMEGDLPSDPFRGDLMYRLWYANQLSDPTGPMMAEIVGDTMQTARAPLALGLTDILMGRGVKPAAGFISGFWDGVLKQMLPTVRSELRGDQTFRPNADTAFLAEGGLRRDGSVRRPFGAQGDIKDVKAPPLLDKALKNIGKNLSPNVEQVLRALPIPQVLTVLRFFRGFGKGFYRSAKEGFAEYIAVRGAKELKLEGEDQRAYVAQQMFSAPKDMELAMTQAKAEAKLLQDAGVSYSADQTTLRAFDIIDEKRAASQSNMREQSHAFAQKLSFDRPVEGQVGRFIKEVMGPIQNYEVPIGGGIKIKPLRYQFSFLNIWGHLVQQGLEHHPLTSPFKVALAKPGIDRQMKAGFGLTGLLGLGTMTALAEAGAIQIHGAGPKGYEDKENLKRTGWKPYSIQIGKQHFGFHEIPFNIVLGGMAAYYDKKRYDPNFVDSFWKKTLWAYTLGTAEVMFQHSFAQSMDNLIQGTHDAIAKGDFNKLENAFISPLKGHIPLVGAGRMIARMFDNPIETQNDMWAKFISGVPFAQRLGTREKLNAFGEPVDVPIQDKLNIVGRFWSPRVSDPDWRWLGDAGYNLPEIQGLTINLEPRSPDRVTPLETKRTAKFGAIYANVLSPNERTKYMEILGPQIRSAVAGLRQKYGTSGYSKRVQEELNSRVNAAKNRTLRQLARE